MGKLESVERKLVDLAKQAAAGDRGAESRLGREIPALAAAPRGKGWPRPGSVAFAVFDALVDASGKKPSALKRLAGALLDAVAAHPESLGLPYRFEPHEQLGDAGIPLLASTFDRAVAKTSRAAIEEMGDGNPLNEPGFAVAAGALER